MKTLLFTTLAILLATAGPLYAPINPVDEKKACLECHSELEKDLQSRHVHKVLEDGKCSSCHNPHAAKHEDLLPSEQGRLCSRCHEEVAAHAQMSHAHPPAANGDCSACHDPHASRFGALVHKAQPGLCVDCHEPAGEWTKNQFVHKPLVDGKCLDCHESHGSEDRGLLGKPVPGLCMNCHSENAAMKKAHAGRSLVETDCTACHDPHASGTRGLLRSNQHEPFAAGDCTKCHADLDKGGSFEVAGATDDACLKCHRGVGTFREATFQHNLDTERSCLNCHNPHASNDEALLARPMVDLCMGCHFNDVPAGTKANYITHDGMECTQCHVPHGNDDRQLLERRDVKLCAGCHEAAHRVSHPVGPDVIDPRTGESVTCLSCHRLHGSEFEDYLPLNPEMALCIQCHKKGQ